jgi:hypothetical protein
MHDSRHAQAHHWLVILQVDLLSMHVISQWLFGGVWGGDVLHVDMFARVALPTKVGTDGQRPF